MELLLAPVIMMLLAFMAGSLLTYAQARFRLDEDPVAEQINQLLPQTQCGQCGYAGCLPYARALAEGDDIDKCPPGGEQVKRQLSDLLDRDPSSLRSLPQEHVHTVIIVEPDCIGCTLCIQACPVDAIIGAAQMTHTVIQELCTGCDLCIEPCPVDCIKLLTPVRSIGDWQWQEPWQEPDRAHSSEQAPP
jgi:electron transport complex protein RnfB